MSIKTELSVLKTNIQNAKNKLYTNLVDKGVKDITTASTLDVMADSVSDIVTGGGGSSEGGKFLCPECISFSGSSNTTEIDLTNLDTSNVTNMSNMFSSCSGLTSLDLSSFNTSKVTNMSSMFNNCRSLTSLDLSNFNTSNVTSMIDMFSYCNNLTSLDLSGWNTSNVTSMNYMFGNCSGLTSLDLSSFDTSNVTDMNYMFSNCYGLTSLNVSSFDTSNVPNMYYMFGNCYKLSRIDGCLDWSKISSYPNSFIISNSTNGYPLRYMVIKNIGKTGTTFNFKNANIQNWGNNTDAIPDARQSLVDTFVTHTYDRASNDLSTCAIQLYSTVKARLTNEEIAQITAKGFTVA